MKKVIAALLSAVMLTSVGALTACTGGGDTGGDGDAKYKYDITVWVGEDTKAVTETMISNFNADNGKGIKFNATVNEVSEKVAAGDALAKPGAAPEILSFAQDQIARLVEAKLLATPTNSITADIKAKHSETAVKAATVGNTVYAYPLTEDNGYLLYYNKDVVTDEQAKTVEGIVEACESNNQFFSFNLDGDGAGWYVSSFFYGAGAKSEWTTNDNGKFTGYEDTFNSDEGLIAMKGIQKVVKSSRYRASTQASDFNAATPAGAVVSGIWEYNTAKNRLGDKLGVAKLPTYTVDGTTYQLKSSIGCKLLGVTPQSDPNKAAALALLAQYLTNETNQLTRYKSFGWGPSEKKAQENSEVKGDVALSALKETATVPQGQYPASWWAKPALLGLRAKESASDAALMTNLQDYENSLAALLS